MTADSLKTLFHPFEAGLLPLPRKGARVLFLGAEPGFRLPEGFEGEMHLAQGFRPDYRALTAARYAVTPRPEGESYDVALLLAGRHRGWNELRVAEAMRRVAPGGLIVVAGGKDDGIASLRKRLGLLVPLGGHSPKYHGVAFWFANPDGAEAADALESANPDMLVDGRFRTRPGMFSFDRVDAGSRLLAGHLPGDLRGHVADFCAGWGFLAAEVAERSPAVSSLDLYEADFEALDAAKLNLAGTGPQKEFFWVDLAREDVGRRYDAVVMNPPFHQGRAAEPELGAAMIRAAAKALKPGGRLFLVANRQLPYEQVLAAAFAQYHEVVRDNGFKVLAARR
ncbi:class I SAM-dependent methyltransferase [Mesorhizobium sp. SP-1A]|uniref:class I SAM-dependent methyltransferase n=1 Tax=Mesorhizobium sp. SP-1A TaxID=3077840 RepID=UPI0028F73D8E|nr:class I SAM-dependent methyltransferase [Mesorhizobium sp. SP-1A]